MSGSDVNGVVDGEAGGDVVVEVEAGGGEVEVEREEADVSEGRAGERVGEDGVRQMISSASSVIASADGGTAGSGSAVSSLLGCSVSVG